MRQPATKPSTKVDAEDESSSNAEDEFFEQSRRTILVWTVVVSGSDATDFIQSRVRCSLPKKRTMTIFAFRLRERNERRVMGTQPLQHNHMTMSRIVIRRQTPRRWGSAAGRCLARDAPRRYDGRAAARGSTAQLPKLSSA
eukprot:4111898-Prymnesium_polylepis.1